jgi:hypothetical protein
MRLNGRKMAGILAGKFGRLINLTGEPETMTTIVERPTVPVAPRIANIFIPDLSKIGVTGKREAQI